MTSIIATNKKQREATNGTGIEVGIYLINKCRAKINQGGLYNVKVGALKRGLRKKAKNWNLLDRLKEKDSSSEHGLILYKQDD